MLADLRPRSFYLKLARHLMLALSIPEGNALVMVFGQGHERSNTEAIANWIAELEQEIDLDEAARRVELLATKAMEHYERRLP